MVNVDIDVNTAMIIRECLFDSQKGHSYEFPSARVNLIRDFIRLLDEKIEEQVKE